MLPPMLEAGKLMPEGEFLNDKVRSISEDGDDHGPWVEHGDNGCRRCAEVGNGLLHPRSE